MSGEAPVGWISAAHPPLAVRETPASYVLDAQRVRPGYKQTEVGVIPEDWEAGHLGNSIKLQGGFAFRSSAFCDIGVPVIRISNVQNGGVDINGAICHPELAIPPEFIVREGDALIAMSGATTGKVGVYRQKQLAYLNQRVGKFVLKEMKRTSISFITQLVRSDLFLERLGVFLEQGAQPNISSSQIESLVFAIPPTKAEQEAIAEALSDADALIESLEQLISKKRHLKQGAMQELLTGKKRLPGFSGEWETFQIGEFADVKTGPFGSSLHESDYVQEGTPIITVEHLGEFGVTRQNLPLVSDEDCKRLHSYALEIGDIVFSRVGSVDRNALIRREEEGWLFSGRLLRVRPDKRRVFAPYLSFQFHTEAFKNAVIAVAVGQTMASLNTKILRDLSVAVPTIDEQTAIATILSDMDTEIAALETRLAKTRSLKQGMMHNLLTGRIRLVWVGAQRGEASTLALQG